jgi:outer membrane protein
MAVSAESLLDIYKLAAEKDPQYRSVQAAREATLEGRPQARAQAYLPVVGLSANVGHNRDSLSSPRDEGSSEFRSHGYTLKITQPIFHYDRYSALDQANSRIQQADLDLGAEQQDLAVRASERYFGVLAALDGSEFAQAEKKALQRQLEQANQRFEVGLIAITDVQEAQAGYDRAVADEIQANNQLDISREALREITSEYHGDLATLGAEVPLLKPEPLDIEQWTKKALEQNLSFYSLRTSIRRRSG